MKIKPQYVAFNAGEVGKEALARVDIDTYHRSAEVMENILPLVQGGMSKMPGTRFVASLRETDPATVTTVVEPRLLVNFDGTPITDHDGASIIVSETQRQDYPAANPWLLPFVFSEASAFSMAFTSRRVRLVTPQGGIAALAGADASLGDWIDASSAPDPGGNPPPDGGGSPISPGGGGGGGGTIGGGIDFGGGGEFAVLF